MRPAYGLLLVFTLFVSLVDSIPLPVNVQRLAWICEPSYYALRVLRNGGLLLAFGLIILFSGSVAIDKKSGVIELLKASSLRKMEYITGKILGGFLSTLFAYITFLFACMLTYLIFLPEATISSSLSAGIQSFLVVAVPVSFFTSAVGICLPILLDIRLMYMLTALLFLLNIFHIGSASEQAPYLLLSGDLIKLVWQHPEFQFDNAIAVIRNLLFIICGGALPAVIVLSKNGYWREKWKG
jgi:hypothetical protein